MTTYPRPDATTTGPRGTGLDPYTGPLTFTATTTLEGVTLTGAIHVKAGTLTVRDFTWHPGGKVTRGFTTSGAGRIVLEHGALNGAGLVDIVLDGARWDVDRCNLHGAVDGVRLVNDCRLRRSWVHTLGRQGTTLHPDCVQSIGGVDCEVTGNALDCRSALDVTPTTVAHGYGDMGNACVQLGNEKQARYPDSVLDRVVVADNWMDGGNYAVNVRPDLGVMPGVVVRGNRFGGTHRHGTILAPTQITVEGNTVTTPTARTQTKPATSPVVAL